MEEVITPVAAQASARGGFLPTKTETQFTPYQQQIHQSKYARWNEEFGRRETWPETVDRYVDFFTDYIRINQDYIFSNSELSLIRDSILSQDVLPSMRALMTAGKALWQDQVGGYNCSYIAIDDSRAFDEIMYILMCGTGVGFSVERKYVSKLPTVCKYWFIDIDKTIHVPDSKIGWAESYRELIKHLYLGEICSWDTSKVRKEGAKLKTFGGRASGPEPLIGLFEFTVEVFRNARGRKLTQKEVHSIVCRIADIVVVGGVRRAALISLTDLDDELMRDAKSGEWWTINPHFALANNSAVWDNDITRDTFNTEWDSLVASGSGERGIFNRQAASEKVASLGKRSADADFGLNPCGEIILRPKQFCNLSQVTVRESDTFDDLAQKVRVATLIGTMQACLTKFRYIREDWRENCEEERLLGVGFTGIMDNPLMNGSLLPDELPGMLRRLRDISIEENKKYAKLFGINEATAIGCVKPAGNSTQLVGSHSSGLHKAHAPFYIRRNRANKNDPVAQLLYYQGVHCEDEVNNPEKTWVFSWPMKAPQSAITRNDSSAINELEMWLIYADNWCEHNPSITITVRDEEWKEVGDWVFNHLDKMVGVTFLPHSNHTYKQAPYEEISEEEFYDLVKITPEVINWSLLKDIELEDMTDSVKDLACVSGYCEV